MSSGNCDPDPIGWLKWRPGLIGIEHDRRPFAFSLTIAALTSYSPVHRVRKLREAFRTALLAQ
jgi:hypothetical protein